MHIRHVLPVNRKSRHLICMRGWRDLRRGSAIGSRLCRSWLALCLLVSTTPGLAAPVCTVGELFAGAADFNDAMQRASEGQGLHDVPPLGWRSLLFIDEKLITAVGQELWYTDLAASEPTLKRLAGREDRKARSSKAGKCSNARFANIGGIALMSDGSLVGADQTANSIFLIEDPFGPGCAVSMIAGANAPQEPVNPGHPLNLGDVDGPGASARLGLPSWVAVNADTVYFIDAENSKIKSVSSDPARTVKTVAKLPDGVYYDMITLRNKLYVIANNTLSEGFLLEIDPLSGSVRDVVRGRSDVWQGSGAINVSGLATDGMGLFTSQSGQLLYVTIDGKVESIAGSGTYLEFGPDYDPTIKHQAKELQLWSARRVQTAGANVFLGYRRGNVYYSAAGLTSYIERIACERADEQ